MKNTIRFLFLISVCSSFALLPALRVHAQAHTAYVKGDVGGNVTLDTDLKEFFGGVSSGSKVKFDPGVRLGVSGGYFLTDWFAVGGEVGVLANNISSISEAESVDAVYEQVPFLATVRFQCPERWVVTPYIGGGVGGSVASLDADHIDLNGTHFEGWMSDVVFAYQAFAGLRFRINDRMGISVEYRYFATESPDWQADVTVNTDTNHARFGGTQSHIASIAFDWRF